MGVPRTRFIKGQWNADCDECGQTFKSSQLKLRWDGAMVCEQDFEERHPSDLFQIPRQERPIPWARPPQNEYVTGLDYQIASGAFAADGSIIADGGVGSPSSTQPIFVTFGPVDPDSLEG